MTTHIYDGADNRQKARLAHEAFRASPHQTATIMYDGAGRYAVGFLGEIEEDLDQYMAPDTWTWIEMEGDGHALS